MVSVMVYLLSIREVDTKSFTFKMQISQPQPCNPSLSNFNQLNTSNKLNPTCISLQIWVAGLVNYRPFHVSFMPSKLNKLTQLSYLTYIELKCQSYQINNALQLLWFCDLKSFQTSIQNAMKADQLDN